MGNYKIKSFRFPRKPIESYKVRVTKTLWSYNGNDDINGGALIDNTDLILYCRKGDKGTYYPEFNELKLDKKAKVNPGKSIYPSDGAFERIK